MEFVYNTVSSLTVEGIVGNPACDMAGQKIVYELCTVFTII